MKQQMNWIKETLLFYLQW